eukprot:5958854-Amphidinium_carterae.1
MVSHKYDIPEHQQALLLGESELKDHLCLPSLGSGETCELDLVVSTEPLFIETTAVAWQGVDEALFGKAPPLPEILRTHITEEEWRQFLSATSCIWSLQNRWPGLMVILLAILCLVVGAIFLLLLPAKAWQQTSMAILSPLLGIGMFIVLPIWL